MINYIKNILTTLNKSISKLVENYNIQKEILYVEPYWIYESEKLNNNPKNKFRKHLEFSDYYTWENN